MWRNYLTVAWRFLLADRLFTFVNLLGLAVGLASVILISLHVTSALGSDRWLPGHERLVRVDTRETHPGREPLDIARAPGPLREALLRTFPEIEDISRAYSVPAGILRDGRPFREELLVADPNFFSLLGLPMARGSAGRALAGTASIALSERAALKYFGRSDVVGSRLTVIAPSPRDFTVAAVFKTLPENSHMTFDVVIPAEGYFPTAGEETAAIPDNWGGAYFFTYARLKPGADIAAIERSLPALVDRSLPQWLTGMLSVPPHRFYSFRFVPLADIPFDGGAIASFKPKQSRTTLLVLAAVAMLILAIAAINFANLTTARSTLRTREVAIRKVVGAKSRQIFVQFMGEAVLLTALAGLIGLSLAELSFPYLASMVGVAPELAPGRDWRFWAIIAFGVLATAIASGLYPSVILSRVRPTALFGRGDAAVRTGLVREILVVAQFAVSIALIAATTVMLMQMRFTREADLNFDSADMLVLRLPEGAETGAGVNGFRERLLREPGVLGASFSSAVPSDPSEDNVSIDRSGEAKPLQIGFHKVDPDFFRTYRVQPLAGRTGGRLVAANSVVINQAALRRLGISRPEQAVGRSLRASGIEYRIVGVVPNLHFRSLHEPVRDEMFILSDTPGRILSVRLARPEIAEAVERLWRERFPDREIERSFLDDDLDALYDAERRQARLLGLFAAIAVLLSCLGLAAMASFAARRRAREVAIRKVLGGRTWDIVKLIAWQFTRPVIIAAFIAWPVAWLAMRGWLNRFDARIELGPGPFLLAGILALAIAIGTIAGHAIKVARANPIHTLRYE
jgi:putative ABC transport system permease protein